MIPCRDFIDKLGYIPIYWELILQHSFEGMREKMQLKHITW